MNAVNPSLAASFANDAETEPAKDETELQRIVRLAELMVAQAREVAELEQKLKEAKAALRRTETEDLPELMREVGLDSVKLNDGSTVEVIEDVDCGISQARRADAHAWLVENGFGGLIKTQVITAFDRGEIEAAMEYARQASEHWPEHPAELKDAVHPATLKSFVKEQLEKGAELPYELFGVRPYARARYKAAR